MIWAIGDLHFDKTKSKVMDIFGENWKNHEDKIIDSWKKNVKEDDLVLVVGDISWALKTKDSLEDLKRIDKLPGKKCFIKGNHDYWWSTKSKLNSLGLDTIHFIFNDAFIYKDYIIAGSRGWLPRDAENFTDEDEKIFQRELLRLEASFNYYSNKEDKTLICIIHYPPFTSKKNPNEFLKLMEKYSVKFCRYGHLHGEGHDYVTEGNYLGIDIKCVSSDYVDFKLQKLF